MNKEEKIQEAVGTLPEFDVMLLCSITVNVPVVITLKSLSEDDVDEKVQKAFKTRSEEYDIILESLGDYITNSPGAIAEEVWEDFLRQAERGTIKVDTVNVDPLM